jgi:hypothetical protein
VFAGKYRVERVIADQGALAPEYAVDLVLEACVGVAEAHAAGIVRGGYILGVSPISLIRWSAPSRRSIVQIM